jgi:serine/threonine protein phosphatase PrpC
MSLITPLDPGPARGKRAQPKIDVQQSVHTMLFGRIVSAVASSCGSVHGVNEDAHSVLDRPGSIFVVADGVGGGALAAMASRSLVAHLQAALVLDGVAAGSVCQAMLDADRSIAQSIAQLTDAPGAATVALCAPVNLLASRWLIAWVGDCRVYRLAANGEPGLQALTVDDTFEHLGESPPPGGSPDDPARMVGNGAVVRPNTVMTDMALNDVLVACSDGVHKYVPAADWSRVLKSDAALSQRCQDLIGVARANGSTDDATVLLVQRALPGVARLPWIRRPNADGAAR